MRDAAARSANYQAFGFTAREHYAARTAHALEQAHGDGSASGAAPSRGYSGGSSFDFPPGTFKVYAFMCCVGAWVLFGMRYSDDGDVAGLVVGVVFGPFILAIGGVVVGVGIFAAAIVAFVLQLFRRAFSVPASANGGVQPQSPGAGADLFGRDFTSQGAGEAVEVPTDPEELERLLLRVQDLANKSQSEAVHQNIAALLARVERVLDKPVQEELSDVSSRTPASSSTIRFRCGRCDTGYNISPDKTAGQILRIRCRSCKSIMVLRNGVLTETTPPTGS
jgi:hypothetical protein